MREAADGIHHGTWAAGSGGCVAAEGLIGHHSKETRSDAALMHDDLVNIEVLHDALGDDQPRDDDVRAIGGHAWRPRAGGERKICEAVNEPQNGFSRDAKALDAKGRAVIDAAGRFHVSCEEGEG